MTTEERQAECNEVRKEYGFFSPIRILDRISRDLGHIRPYRITRRQRAILAGIEMILSRMVTNQVLTEPLVNEVPQVVLHRIEHKAW